VSRRLIFLSDAHLFPSPRPHPGRARLLCYLQSLRASAPGDLWIAGDLFDYWFEHGRNFPGGHEEVLSALKALSSAGWSVSFLPGNHDWWVAGGFARATGAAVVRERVVILESGGLRVILTHGDGLGGGDAGYRFLLRPLLRNSVSMALFSLIPQRFGAFLARAASGTSRRILRRQAEEMPAGLGRWAADRIADGFDLVITGHTHLAAEIPSGRGLHISLGDWLKSFTLVELQDGKARLLTSPDVPAGENPEGPVR
jgi:UDP-2,3-diacylglucosamine hydrolase